MRVTETLGVVEVVAVAGTAVTKQGDADAFGPCVCHKPVCSYSADFRNEMPERDSEVIGA